MRFRAVIQTEGGGSSYAQGQKFDEICAKSTFLETDNIGYIFKRLEFLLCRYVHTDYHKEACA